MDLAQGSWLDSNNKWLKLIMDQSLCNSNVLHKTKRLKEKQHTCQDPKHAFGSDAKHAYIHTGRPVKKT